LGAEQVEDGWSELPWELHADEEEKNMQLTDFISKARVPLWDEKLAPRFITAFTKA
jgi:hypothetical protein